MLVGNENQNLKLTLGDINALTKVVLENVPQDEFDKDLGIGKTLETAIITRNSEYPRTYYTDIKRVDFKLKKSRRKLRHFRKILTSK